MTTATGPVVIIGVDQLIDTWERGELKRFGPAGRQVLRAAGWRTTSLTRIEHLQATDLTVLDAAWRGGLVLARAHVDTVSLRRCRTADFIVFEDCTIEVLDVREVKGTVSLQRCRIGQVRLHDVSTIAVDDLLAGHVKVSGPCSGLDISALTCDVLRVSDIGNADHSAINVVDARVRDRIEIEGVANVSLSLRRPRLGTLSLRDVTARAIELTDAVADGDVLLNGLSGPDATACQITVSGLFGAHFSVDASPDISPSLDVVLDDAAISGDLFVAGTASVDLRSGRIEGSLRCQQGAQPPITVRTDPRFHVNAVDVPPDRIRNGRAAVAASQSLLGASGPAALGTLRRSLTDRPREQDQVYFAERHAQVRPGWAGIVDRVQQWTFGFGVRLSEPLGFLVAGIVATAVVIHAFTPAVTRAPRQHVSAVGDACRTLAFATQLWFNVGVGLPTAASGPGWAVAAVTLTVLGVLMVTTLIGIGIRRLVR